MVSGFFTRRITQLQSVGDVLSQRRLSLGIALERVARETQIQTKYLAALEQGKRRYLPAEIYVRGFVRSYARYLRLDEQAILGQWERERGIARHLAGQTSSPIDPRKTFLSRKSILPRVKITPLVFRSGLVALVIIAGLVYVLLAVSSLGRKPTLALTEPPSDRMVADSALVVVGETSQSARLTINGQPVQVTSDGHFRETLTLQDGMNLIKIVAASKLGRETEIVRNIQANLEPLAVRNDTRPAEDGGKVVDATQTSESAGPVDVAVEIIGEATWISVDVDGKSAFEGTLLPNSKKRFSGQERVVLTSGKAEHTAIEFKGEKLTRLGEGFIRGVTFTEDLDLNELSTAAALQGGSR
ncbi:MAG: RodZ domain-containing protein [Parcubacteria group bacterium]